MKRAEPGALIEVRRILTDEASSCRPALFPSDPTVASNPGLYSWRVDGAARRLISEVLHSDIPPLIYAGQAGATQWPSVRKSSATLASRIRANHINGNASSSTFRLTISAILLEPLDLKGALVTADALHTQTQTARHLVEDKGADYLFCVKGNQPSLLESLWESVGERDGDDSFFFDPITSRWIRDSRVGTGG